MIRKLVDKYLAKKNLTAVNETEFKNMLRYRATRGELKKTIDDFNSLLQKYVYTASVKEMKELLEAKKIEDIPTKKDEIQALFVKTFIKEFKKN